MAAFFRKQPDLHGELVNEICIIIIIIFILYFLHRNFVHTKGEFQYECMILLCNLVIIRVIGTHPLFN